MYSAEDDCVFQNFNDQEIMLSDLVEIWKLSVHEEAEDPEPKYKERTMMVLKLTERIWAHCSLHQDVLGH
jgi:hypothetical protein